MFIAIAYYVLLTTEQPQRLTHIHTCTDTHIATVSPGKNNFKKPYMHLPATSMHLV